MSEIQSEMKDFTEHIGDSRSQLGPVSMRSGRSQSKTKIKICSCLRKAGTKSEIAMLVNEYSRFT